MAKKNIFCWRNILIALLFTPILLYIIWLETISYQLKSIKEKMKAAGNPVTLENLAEIAAQYENKENAFEYIIEAGEIKDWPPAPDSDARGIGMKRHNTTDEVPVYGYYPENIFQMTDQDKVNLKEYLKAHKPQLEAIDNAIKIGWYAEKTDWLDGINVLLPSLSNYKDATRLIQHKTIDLVHDGEIESAVSLLCNWYNLVNNSSDNRPYTIIQALVSIGCISLLNETANWMISEINLNDEQLSRLYNSIKPVDCKEIIPRAYETEIVFGLTFLEKYNRLNELDIDLSDIESYFYYYSGLTKLNAIKYYETCDKLKQTSKYEYFQMANMQTAKKIDLEIENSNRFIYRPFRIFFPPTSRFAVSMHRTKAGQQILKIIIANEMYKNNNETYAENLETLKQYKPDLDINDMFTASDQFGYRTITTDNKILEYFIWSKSDKTYSEIKDVIDKMIADDLNSIKELPDNHDKEFIIYRIKAK